MGKSQKETLYCLLYNIWWNFQFQRSFSVLWTLEKNYGVKKDGQQIMKLMKSIYPYYCRIYEKGPVSYSVFWILQVNSHFFNKSGMFNIENHLVGLWHDFIDKNYWRHPVSFNRYWLCFRDLCILVGEKNIHQICTIS